MGYNSYNDYLVHHGVKGMKWGVRKKIEADGYRRASLYTQKRDIRNLKRQKKTSGMSDETYKQRKRQIKNKAAINRGKKYVEANQSVGKIRAKSVAKTAAFAAGTAAATALAVGTGGAMLVPYAVGTGAGMALYSIKNDAGRIKDIKAYNRR